MQIRHEESGEGRIARRALTICQAIQARKADMIPVGDGGEELQVGPYTIRHLPPELYPDGPWHNVNIWESGSNELANIEWNEAHGWAVVGIVSYHGGDWERELLELLIARPAPN